MAERIHRLQIACKAFSLRIAVAVGSLVTVLSIGELATRLFVPETAFAVLADSYVQDSSSGVGYTLKHSFAGEIYGVPLHTNSLGFRGPDWSSEKKAGSLRIALIGDSHAFGYGVKFEQTMGEILAKRLSSRLARPVEVMNFGVSGYNSEQELAVFERYAMPLKPDLVLVLTCNNDNDPAMWVDRQGFLRTGAVGDDGDRKNMNADWRQRGLIDFREHLLGMSRFLLFLRIQWYKVSIMRGAAAAEAAQGAEDRKGWLAPVEFGPCDETLRQGVLSPLNRLVDDCRSMRVPVGMLTFTSIYRWRCTLKGFCRDRDVPYLELIPLLEGADSWASLLQKWSLGWDAHMGPAAQEVWAKGVEQFMVQEGLLRL